MTSHSETEPFRDNPQQVLDLLSERLGTGGGHTELRWHANSSSQLSMRKGVLMENRRSHASGVSARVFLNGLYGFAALPREDGEAMSSVLADARRNAAVNRRHVHSGVGLATSRIANAIHTPHPSAPALAWTDRIELLKQVDAEARKKYPDLVDLTLSLGMNGSAKAVATGAGACCYSDFSRSVFSARLSIDSAEGPVALADQLGGLGDVDAARFEPTLLMAMIDSIYDELRQKAEGVHCEPGQHDVVLDPRLAGILAHEAIGHTCEADIVEAGSIAGDWLGQQVASEKITLGDYAGRGPDGQSNFEIHVDDEGTECRDVTIVENGVLRAFMHDKRTAAAFGAEPMGNARAFAYNDEPLVRMRNTAILGGEDKLDDMIGAIDRGYYLTRTGNGQADTTSEFMFSVQAGREIRNGKLGRAIRDTTISGVAFDMLKSVTHVGNDFKWSGPGGWCGKGQLAAVGMGGPSIKCRITVAGRK